MHAFQVFPPPVYTVTPEAEDITNRILELDADNATKSLAINLAAAFCAQVVEAQSIDAVREKIRTHGFDHPGMMPFWNDVAQGIIEEFLEEFRGTGEPGEGCGDPDCTDCGGVRA